MSPNFARSPAESFQRPDALRRQLGAHAERRRDAELLRGAKHHVELLDALEHDDDGLVEALREERGLDVLLVLVAVAEDEPSALLRVRERDEELGLAAGLEAEAPGRAELDDLLDDVPLLVDLHRVDAAVDARVLVLGDGPGEALVEPADAVAQDVREANEEREREAARLEILSQLEEVDAAILARRIRAHLDVALARSRRSTARPSRGFDRARRSSRRTIGAVLPRLPAVPTACGSWSSGANRSGRYRSRGEHRDLSAVRDPRRRVATRLSRKRASGVLCPGGQPVRRGPVGGMAGRALPLDDSVKRPTLPRPRGPRVVVAAEVFSCAH